MNNKTRAEVEWSPMRENNKRKLEANWVLLLRNGQLARIIAGRSERIELEKRHQIYVRIRNLPRFTKEVLLLRQLKGINAKVVHIFQNKNRNPRSQVVIEFENKEDRERALERKLKYFNYTIEWEYTVPYRKDNRNMITSHTVTTRRPSVAQYNQVAQTEKERYNRRELQKEKETRKKEKVPQAPNERLNNKEEINQERHRLEELAQRLVEEIKEKLIWKLSNSMKIGAELSQCS
ncbi:hypothetical protein F8M41_010039 [Gigaspora margarita]|uniref:Uncharacterized protein n=1 Tax=Gigaspora margarita TaxID=4874 RepID=A0A8H4AUV0_GIGMA|nr:hypothetical protein F8M41_010039 [Gigaspora margarita]